MSDQRVQERQSMFHDSYQSDPRLLPVSALAYIGDSVYELHTRLKMLAVTQGKSKGIHRQTIAKVNATAQSDAAHRLLDRLTEEELLVFKRGRNAHTRSMAKNAAAADYQTATGLETLIGFLFLMKREDRLDELFSIIDADDSSDI